MNTALITLLIALALSAALFFLSHGHVLLIALPPVLGLPLASVFGRRRR